MTKKRTKQEEEKLLTLGRAVISTETEALKNLLESIDENFVRACFYILDCKGRVVVLGMGKSGHIGNKIAATLSSTGSPAFFVHPGEASHGDLGMIKDDDVVLALSNSGETDEIITLLPVIKRLGVPLITLTGNTDSMLAKTASVNIHVGVEKEACPLGLTPTASTTAALAMGDALAIALLEARGFGAEDFAIAHPGGMLGRRLLLHVGDIMHRGEELPAVLEDTLLSETLLIMTQMGLGSSAIIDEENCVLGIFTDGDLRRALDNNIDVHKTVVGKVMTRNCKSINKDCLAAEALAIMEDSRINALPVVNAENKLIGLLNMHDLLRARVV
ncbi:MAG: KpsF/GutQ family sugar-phosphate isomerase [Proteobacteria bacterium]|nr:KpsF/GutQ family sugar-phosphate isomerase [Pseudomonadota bacterium]